MYNVNYGDGRNFQSWPPQQLQQHHQQQLQQQQQQLQQQQQQQQKHHQHQHRQQQMPMKQPLPRQHQSPRNKEQTSEGLWVDVRNDDDSVKQQMSVFKTSSKTHLTPPLDLSENRRQVESPLDLSVKTRKRCADTTEYGEISRQSILSDTTMAKRMCVTRDYAYPQGHPNFQKESFSDKPFRDEHFSRSKLTQNKQLPSLSKYPQGLHKSSSQISPSALAQKQCGDIQRQQTIPQARQQPRSGSSPYGIASVGVPQQIPPSIQKKSVPYDSVPSTSKRNPNNMTESVALKGFFEPTHKVTVNASTSQQTPHLPQQQQYPRGHVDQRMVSHGSHSISGKQRELSEFEDHGRHQALHNSPVFQRQAPPMGTGYNMQPNTGTDLELIKQQEQLQFQRQLQAQKSQREQMAIMSQLNREKLVKAQEQQQQMAYLLDMQKQTECRLPQTQTQNPYANRTQHSPYSRQQAAATTSYQDSLRKDRNDFSPARCIRVGQPVPLSDIHQEHSQSFEQVHTLQNRPDIIAKQFATDNYGSRNKDSYHNQPAMLNSRMSHTIRYEPTARFGINKDANIENPTNFSARHETSNSGINIHPSVIQRPQGFIPPRIVRGNGMSTDSATRRVSMDHNTEGHIAPRLEFSAEQTHRVRQDYMSKDRSAQHKHNDMLSGKEVMKIQQRVAEQRGETHFGFNGPSKSYVKHSQQREIDEKAFSSVSGKNSIRRRSLQENQIHENVGEHSRPSVNEVKERRDSLSKNTKVYTQIPDIKTHKTDVHNISEKQMISFNTYPPERSITKGTSGMKKSEMDPFSQFLMRELKKTDDDKSINPFANRSLLDEFDRSANSSPVQKIPSGTIELLDEPEDKQTINKSEVIEMPKKECNSNVKEDSSYTVPLQIAIPGHKVSSSTSGTTSSIAVSSSTASNTTSVITSKFETTGSKHPKLMSRKHMILNAFRQEEDLKNATVTVDIDKNEKVPVESAKYAARKLEKDLNQLGCPTSPKMPILSPQERNRNALSVNPAVGEPPNLEESSRSNTGNDSSKKEINSLEEHLHRLISDAVKGSKNDKESVYETVRRELSSQPQKVILSRQISQNKNIPVANVAPIVHGKAITDALEGHDKTSCCKTDEELDEEDTKMADIVTRSLFGDQTLFGKRAIENETENVIESPMKHENDMDISDSNLSMPGSSVDALYDENSNSKRMSPGLKKLMLYRHRDNSANSNDSCQSNDLGGNSAKSWSSRLKKEQLSDNETRSKSPRGKARNVFGAFSEIVAQESKHSIGNIDREETKKYTTDNPRSGNSHWAEFRDEKPEDIQRMCNTDYDGDDEQVRESLAQQRMKHSNTRQQAERLIKKARHRRNSKQEGDVRSRHALHVKRKSHKGFVDFRPQVLPRRTRSKSSASSQKRKGKSGSPTRKHSRRSTSHDVKSHASPRKSRQRRASSLDRETKSKPAKAKPKQGYFSDNDRGVDKPGQTEQGYDVVDSDATWHNEDESTDEDYFQNYEDEFRKVERKGDTTMRFKKTNVAKKKKGFHFKQKYIFQKKRRTNKGRGRAMDPTNRFGARLEAIYSFHEEAQDLDQFQKGSNDLSQISCIPVPVDLKRVAVGKDSGQTVLHRAARMGFEEVVLYCLATGSVDVNARDNAGYTALHECALRGRVQIGKHLLTYGADVNCCSTDGIRPIHDAVENDQLEMLRLLLSFGADPTLSTYAGRPLIKIARSERMLKYIQRYNCDINGYASEGDEKPWQFKRQSSIKGKEIGNGCAICDDVPSDPEDESQELCTFSSKPLFLTKRLSLDPIKRVEDFLLLDDILDGYNMTRSEFFSHGSSAGVRHLVKHIPHSTLIEAHLDSIYCEGLLKKDQSETVEAIRKVDSTQLLTKLDKCTSIASSKRAKI